MCYSWWDLASLSILDRIHWINRDKLIDFILSAQVRINLYFCRGGRIARADDRIWKVEELPIDQTIG